MPKVTQLQSEGTDIKTKWTWLQSCVLNHFWVRNPTKYVFLCGPLKTLMRYVSFPFFLCGSWNLERLVRARTETWTLHISTILCTLQGRNNVSSDGGFINSELIYNWTFLNQDNLFLSIYYYLHEWEFPARERSDLRYEGNLTSPTVDLGKQMATRLWGLLDHSYASYQERYQI